MAISNADSEPQGIAFLNLRVGAHLAPSSKFVNEPSALRNPWESSIFYGRLPVLFNFRRRYYQHECFEGGNTSQPYLSLATHNSNGIAALQAAGTIL